MSAAISAAMSTASGSETDRSERSAHTVTAEALATATAAARHRWDDWVCQVCGNRNRGFRERCNLNVCRAPCAFPGPYSPAVSATGYKNAHTRGQPTVTAHRPPSPAPMAAGHHHHHAPHYMPLPAQPMYCMPHAPHMPAMVPPPHHMMPPMMPVPAGFAPGMVLVPVPPRP